MRVPDSAMATYYDLLLGEAVPELAAGGGQAGARRRIVERFHGAEAAAGGGAALRPAAQGAPAARGDRGGRLGPDAVSNGSVHLPALLAEHFGLSRSEARRLLGQGGVRLDGEPLGDDDLDIAAERLRGASCRWAGAASGGFGCA